MDGGKGVFVGGCVSGGTGVLVGVCVEVAVDVLVTVGVSVGREAVLVEVIERNASVCITDQVFAAKVSGIPGVSMTLRVVCSHEMLNITTTRNKIPGLIIRFFIVPPLIDPLTLV